MYNFNLIKGRERVSKITDRVCQRCYQSLPENYKFTYCAYCRLVKRKQYKRFYDKEKRLTKSNPQ